VVLLSVLAWGSTVCVGGLGLRGRSWARGAAAGAPLRGLELGGEGEGCGLKG